VKEKKGEGRKEPRKKEGIIGREHASFYFLVMNRGLDGKKSAWEKKRREAGCILRIVKPKRPQRGG